MRAPGGIDAPSRALIDKSRACDISPWVTLPQVQPIFQGPNSPPTELPAPRPAKKYCPTVEAAKRAIRAGHFAPTFRLQDLHGGSVALIDLIERGPSIISF